MKRKTLACLLASAALAASGTAQSLVESGGDASGESLSYRLLGGDRQLQRG